MATQQRFVVIGGGNSSTILATLAHHAGYHVTILTRRPQDWARNGVGFLNDDALYLGGKTHLTMDLADSQVTSDPSTCIPNADVIFIAGLPIHLNPVVLKQIKPFVNPTKEDLYIGSICSYGGFNWVCADVLGPGRYKIFGTQNIPWTCGTDVYGKTGHVFGAKRMLRIATEDGGKSSASQKAMQMMKKILRMENLQPTSFLASLFWPNNPVIHPPILYGLFKDWDPKTQTFGEKGFGKEVPELIYADLREDSEKAMACLDKEVVSIVKKLSERFPDDPHLAMNFHVANATKEKYQDQVTDISTVGQAFRTNKAYAKHKIPYTEVVAPGSNSPGWVPTLKHKFFETDLPFGLCTHKDIAVMLGMGSDTPMLDTIIAWNQRLIDKEYLVYDKNGKSSIRGANARECVLPSNFGLAIDDLASSAVVKQGSMMSRL